MTVINCAQCRFCTKQDTANQIGLCIEEHSPRNAQGQPMKTVFLWMAGCRYRASNEKPRQSRRTAK